MPRHERPRTCSLHFPHRQLNLGLAGVLEPRCSETAWGNGGLRYLFENCVLDTDRRELRRGAELVAISPQVFDLLDYLIRNREHVVSKDDLIEAIWRGRIVSEAALTTRLNAARSAIGDTGEEQRLIKTLPRKGFRFVGTVREGEGPTAATAADKPQEPPQPALTLPDIPSIAVLPFANLSSDPEQEYFADGLVEDIITALSRYNSLFVIARNSSFTYKGKAVDIKQVGRELGVRYVLEGSVRKVGSRLRIAGQLIDASTGSHLWAERFDGALEDVFELQDKVASCVAGVINPVLMEAEIKRALVCPTADLTAYDLLLRALPLIRLWAREPIVKAIDLLNRAIERDPLYGKAVAYLAFCHSINAWSGWGDDTVAESDRGRTLARRALESAPDDPTAVFMAASALVNLGDDFNVLKGLVDNAVARNPSSALGWLSSGWIRTFMGESDPAIEHFEMSLRLDPRTTRRAFHLTGIGICHLFQRRFDQATAALESSLHELPTYPTTAWFLASCYAQMGRVSEAREFAARQGIRPGGPWLKRASLFRKPEHQELLLSGLKLATGEQA
jgi:adenylate cyclase